jgi:hypothetical protein
VGEQLRSQGKDGPAKIADQAAERVESLGSYLSSADADRILSDVEDFGRRNPWAVALGGVALGFAASRLLKASSSERYQARSASGASGTSTGTGTGTGTPALPRQTGGTPGSFGGPPTEPPRTAPSTTPAPGTASPVGSL